MTTLQKKAASNMSLVVNDMASVVSKIAVAVSSASKGTINDLLSEIDALVQTSKNQLSATYKYDASLRSAYIQSFSDLEEDPEA